MAAMHPHAEVIPAHALEVDDNTDDDTDSAVTDLSRPESTASLASSILHYRQENGRTYHAYKDGKYFYPNDEIENDRLDLQHHIFLLSMSNRLHLAPLRNPQSILDIGTGTGIWALDIADQYPEAKVTGVDLSPIQPTLVPPNLSFLIDDCEEKWMYSEKFDYIHGRMMTSSFSDPLKVFKEAYKFLKPGGYFEMQDIVFPIKCDDNSMPDGSPVLEWSKLLLKACEVMGKSMNQTLSYSDWFAEAGFTDIQLNMYKWPINPWPKSQKDKELGLLNQENLMEGFQGLSIAAMTRGLGWSREELETFLVDVRKDCKNKKRHGYFEIHAVVGKKPEDPTASP